MKPETFSFVQEVFGTYQLDTERDRFGNITALHIYGKKAKVRFDIGATISAVNALRLMKHPDILWSCILEDNQLWFPEMHDDEDVLYVPCPGCQNPLTAIRENIFCDNYICPLTEKVRKDYQLKTSSIWRNLYGVYSSEGKLPDELHPQFTRLQVFLDGLSFPSVEKVDILDVTNTLSQQPFSEWSLYRSIDLLYEKCSSKRPPVVHLNRNALGVKMHYTEQFGRKSPWENLGTMSSSLHEKNFNKK